MNGHKALVLEKQNISVKEQYIAMSKRPERQLPPELFYDEKEAKKYTSSSRYIKIQDELANRSLELLNLQPKEGPNSSKLILDIGCGSGLSGK